MRALSILALGGLVATPALADPSNLTPLVDAQASVKRDQYTAALKYADYRADRFGTDTKKLCISLDWAFA